MTSEWTKEILILGETIVIETDFSGGWIIIGKLYISEVQRDHEQPGHVGSKVAERIG